MALTNPASLSSNNLANDLTFQTRIKLRLAAACQNIYSNNGVNVTPDAVLFYTRRRAFAVQVLMTLNGGAPNYALNFAYMVANDGTVLSDATAGLTVDVTTSNAAASGNAVTDAHIDNAIASQINSFLQAA
jgi:hypothetical protein